MKVLHFVLHPVVCLSLLVCMANSQYVQVFFLVCMSVIVCVYV